MRFDEAPVEHRYELGSVPDEIEDLGPTLGDDDAPPHHGRPVETRRGPGFGALAPASGTRPYRRERPPASSGRRAFLAGLLGVCGLAAAGGLAVRAWRGRDWLALLSGDPFEVRLDGHGAITGRAGRLYVVHGTVTNLSGAPKGFFEVRARLLDEDGRTIAERTVYAGHVLAEPELKGLSRAELERRVSETVFGDGMANARVEPRRSIPFQVVFVPAPSARRVADVAVAVVGVKDVP